MNGLLDDSPPCREDNHGACTWDNCDCECHELAQLIDQALIDGAASVLIDEAFVEGDR